MLRHAKLLNCIVEGIVDDEMVQPNAIDIRCDSLELVNNDLTAPFILDSEGTKHRNVSELPLRSGAQWSDMFWRDHTADLQGRLRDAKLYWRLDQGKVYRFLSGLTVQMPAGVAGWLIPRSSMIRNGVFLLSGLFDSGYRGPIGAVINVVSGPMYLEQGTRIGQFIMADSETTHMYAGQYNEPTSPSGEPMGWVGNEWLPIGPAPSKG